MTDKNDVVFGSWTGNVLPIWDEIEITSEGPLDTAIYVPTYKAGDDAPFIGAIFYPEKQTGAPPWGQDQAWQLSVGVIVDQPFGPPALSPLVTFESRNSAGPVPFSQFAVPVIGQQKGSIGPFLYEPWINIAGLSGQRLKMQANGYLKGKILLQFTSNINRG